MAMQVHPELYAIQKAALAQKRARIRVRTPASDVRSRRRTMFGIVKMELGDAKTQPRGRRKLTEGEAAEAKDEGDATTSESHGEVGPAARRHVQNPWTRRQIPSNNDSDAKVRGVDGGSGGEVRSRGRKRAPSSRRQLQGQPLGKEFRRDVEGSVVHGGEFGTQSRVEDQTENRRKEGPNTKELQQALQTLTALGRKMEAGWTTFRATRCFMVELEADEGKEVIKRIFAVNGHPEVEEILEVLRQSIVPEAARLNLGHEFASRSRQTKLVKKLAFPNKRYF